MICRFLIAQTAPPGPPSANANISRHVRAAWDQAVMNLLAIAFIPEQGEKTVTFTPSARDLYAAAHDRLHALAMSRNDPLLREHLQNLVGYIPRLALVLHVMRRPHDPAKRVNRATVAAAIEWVDFFSDEVQSIYADHRNPHTDEVSYLVEIIEHHNGQITPRELMHASHRYRRSVDHARAALQNLVDLGLGEMDYIKGPRDPVLTFRLFTSNSNNFTPGADQKRGFARRVPRIPGNLTASNACQDYANNLV